MNMKRTISIAAFIACGVNMEAAIASAAPNQTIPDDPYNGVGSTVSVSGQGILSAGFQLQVNLVIDGEWNGDLYAYLTHSGTIAILLNRPGRNSIDPYGYKDSGMNITLQDYGPIGANKDIHWYQDTVGTHLRGQLTGTWAPDGRQSFPTDTIGTEDRTANLGAFSNIGLDGSWTLFMADMSPGSSQRLVSWSLDVVPISTVPEPSTWFAGLGAIGMLAYFAAKGVNCCKTKQDFHLFHIASSISLENDLPLFLRISRI